MEIRDLFQGIANRLLTDFEQIQSQIGHAGERGRQRERAVQIFLEKYLPKKYAIGTGHVVDRSGNTSRQCDIVIYDAFNCPLLLAEDGYQLFPVEAVFGVIEVKSVLDASVLAEGVSNIQSVKQLNRHKPMLGGLFAYHSRYRKEPKIDMVADVLYRKNISVRPSERIDILCVLKDGVILDYRAGADSEREEEEEAITYIFFDIGPSILLFFLYYLIEFLEERNSSMPNLVSYALKGTGVVAQMKAVASAPYAED